MNKQVTHRGFILLKNAISISVISATITFASQLFSAEFSTAPDGLVEIQALQTAKKHEPSLLVAKSINLIAPAEVTSALLEPSSLNIDIPSLQAAGTIIVNEGFEGSFPNGIWSVGPGPAGCVWGKTNIAADVGNWSASPVASGCSGSPAISYAENMNTWMVYGPFDLSDATSATLTFRTAIELENPTDSFSWLSSADGGSFSGFSTTGGNFVWSDVSFDLSDRVTDDSVWIALIMKSDGNSSTDRGVLVDEILIEKSTDEPLSDLALQTIDVEPGPYLPGGDIGVTTLIENIGSETSNSWSVTYYASVDTTITDADTSMGTCSGLPVIDAGANSFFTCLTSVPGGLANGDYFIGGILNVLDANDTNHVNHDATPITVTDDPEIDVRPLSLSFTEPQAAPPAQNSTTAQAAAPIASSTVLASLFKSVDRKGSSAVIVGFNTPFLPVGALNQIQKQNQAQAITSTGNQLLSTMAGLNYTLKNRYQYIPFMAMRVDRAALEFLTRSALISHIEEDRVSHPFMESSNQVIGSPLAWAEGLDGTGWAVAVLDTGVDNTHSWFNGKIVSEACYGSNNPGFVESFCPGGTTSSTAVNSGLHCDLTISGCDHGTHVAGTVAGNDGIGPNFGVASGAEIIAIQVFSKFLTEDDCGAGEAPCTLSRTSDQIGALERVLTLSAGMNIASVNMSLGGGQYFDQASCDADNSSIKAAIDTLRSVGIATVIAAGNDGWTDSIGAPGCVSTAISVGATTDSDAVASFSNIYPEIHLLAPGVSIMSSVPGNAIGSKQGTSMATPHVAGAWAVMKHRTPGASVGEVLTNLQSTATPVNDIRGGGIETNMPRINVDLAIGTPRTTFGVFNAGPATLSVTSIALDSPAAWIGWTPSNFDVAPGELQVVEITIDYALAPDGNSQRRLLISSDDPDENPFPGGVFINVSTESTVDYTVFMDGFE